jgi:hypothetical protein
VDEDWEEKSSEEIVAKPVGAKLQVVSVGCLLLHWWNHNASEPGSVSVPENPVPREYLRVVE